MEHYFFGNYFYSQALNNFIDLLKIVVPALLTFLSGFFGLKYGVKLFKIQKRTDFIEKQLNNLYGPLSALHKTIESIAFVRYKISSVGDEVAEDRSNNSNPVNPRSFEKDLNIDIREIEYNNDKLNNKILPLYDKMLGILTDNLYLADEETKKYLVDLSEFVELWDRWQKKAIMPEVIKKINFSEEKLRPFHKHIDQKVEELIAEISFAKSKNSLFF